MNDEFRVVIVGGGGSAAVAARSIAQYRPGTRVDVFTKRNVAGYRPCELTYVMGGEIPDFETMIGFNAKAMESNNIHYHFNTEIREIHPLGKFVETDVERFPYDRLILACGATPTIPTLPGLNGHNEYVLGTDMEQSRKFNEVIAKHSSAIIVGAGAIGLEAAEILVKRGYNKVTVIEVADRVLARSLDSEMSDPLEAHLRGAGIELIFNSRLEKVAEENGQKVVTLSDRQVSGDFILFCTGFKANTKLAIQAGITLGQTNAIKVNSFLQTSDPDIYAIGDVAEGWDLIGERPSLCMIGDNAVRTGKTAARNAISSRPLSYPGSVSSFVIRLAGYYFAATGYTETRVLLEAERFKPEIVIFDGTTRPSYLGGSAIKIKLVFNGHNQQLIGAQLLSSENITAHLDRLSLAIMQNLTAAEISLAETCYTPAASWTYGAVAQAVDKYLANSFKEAL